jgi:hypothetical protein
MPPAILVVLLLGAPNARSQAKAMVEDAARAFRAARYEEAAKLYLEVYDFAAKNDLPARPELLLNAGIAFERTGRCERVVELFARYLEAKPEDRTEDLTLRMKKAEACAPEITFETTPPGATVTIDGQPRGSTPLVLRLRAGSHTVRLEGLRAIEESVVVREGEPATIARVLHVEPEPEPQPAPVLDLAPPPPPPPPIEVVHVEEKGSGYGTAAWITGAGTVAALGTGIALTLLSRSAFDRQEEERARPAELIDSSLVRSAQDDSIAFAIGGDVAFGVAGALAITTGILLWLYAVD